MSCPWITEEDSSSGSGIGKFPGRVLDRLVIEN